MSAVTSSDLGERINAAHNAALGAGQTMLAHAVECGRLLSEAKDQVGHGQWIFWIKDNLRFGERQAQKYMRLAQHPDALSNAHSNSLLTIDSAIEAIAQPGPKTKRPAKRVAPPTAESPSSLAQQDPVLPTTASGDLIAAWEAASDVERLTFVMQHRAELLGDRPYQWACYAWQGINEWDRGVFLKRYRLKGPTTIPADVQEDDAAWDAIARGEGSSAASPAVSGPMQPDPTPSSDCAHWSKSYYDAKGDAARREVLRNWCLRLRGRLSAGDTLLIPSSAPEDQVEAIKRLAPDRKLKVALYREVGA